MYYKPTTFCRILNSPLLLFIELSWIYMNSCFCIILFFLKFSTANSEKTLFMNGKKLLSWKVTIHELRTYSLNGKSPPRMEDHSLKVGSNQVFFVSAITNSTLSYIFHAICLFFFYPGLMFPSLPFFFLMFTFFHLLWKS